MTSEHLLHTIPPIYDGNSKILILGSFPSVKSREVSFYYGHPQNRFGVCSPPYSAVRCHRLMKKKQLFCRAIISRFGTL